MSVERLQMASRRQVEKTKAFKDALVQQTVAEWSGAWAPWTMPIQGPASFVRQLAAIHAVQDIETVSEELRERYRRFSGMTVGEAVAEMLREEKNVGT